MLGLILGCFVLAGAPSPVSACVGGMDFAWAVGQARDGIVEGRVIDALDTHGNGISVHLDGVTRVLGDPPMSAVASLTMGDVCEQVADSGETVWLLYGLRGLDLPKGLTVAFVVDGPDGVGREAANAALAALPATEMATTPPARPKAMAMPGLLVVWLLSFLAVLATSARRGQGPRAAGGPPASGGG